MSKLLGRDRGGGAGPKRSHGTGVEDRDRDGLVLRAVVPELGLELFPVCVWHRSSGAEDTIPLNEKNVAAAFTAAGKVIVMLPFKSAVRYWEKTSVRTPFVPVPLVTSASLVKLPRLSLTVAPVLSGSMAKVTNTVFPALTLAG